MREVVFVDGMRTAFGKRGGSLKGFNGSQLAVLVAKGLLEKTRLLELGAKPDAILCGSALGDSGTTTPARYVALGCGLEDTVGITVEMQCGSSIAAVNSAAARIMAGCSDIVLAGGFESHSRRIAAFSTWVEPYKGLGPQSVTRTLCPYPEQNVTMPEFADLMAQRWQISREACDEFALRSQQLAAAAVAKGYFKDEIVPVEIPGTKKEPGYLFDTDEHLRPSVTLESLKKLPPVRGGDNVTTAGNASGLNDGASFLLMMTAEKARELGYEPFARWVTGADVGVDPRYTGIGAAYSNLKAIQRAGLCVSDMDVMECNEAFAAQNLGVIKEMEICSGKRVDMEKWNPNGGAIAFGHPNGASGTRIGIFCMKELERRGGRYGIFSSCCGGGQGVSAIIENLRR